MSGWIELFKRKKPRKLLGIEWFAESLKIVEIHSDKQQFIIKNCAVISVADTNNIEKIIRNILFQMQPQTQYVVTALSPTLLSRKIIDLDYALSEMEIYHYLSLSLENYFGIAAEQLYFDFKKISFTSAESQVQKIEVVAARRSDVAALQKLLTNIGLSVVAIDTPMNVLTRINKLFLQESGFWFYLQKNSAWLCWQDEFFQSGDIVQFNYPESLSTSELVNLLQHQLQMMIANLPTNISRKIFLSGVNATPQLAQQLQECSKLMVKVVNPLSQLVNETNYDLDGANLDWIFAAGLALWGQV